MDTRRDEAHLTTGQTQEDLLAGAAGRFLENNLRWERRLARLRSLAVCRFESSVAPFGPVASPAPANPPEGRAVSRRDPVVELA